MGNQTRTASRFRGLARSIRSKNPADIDVEILTASVTDNTLDVSVSISTSTTDTIDYRLNINDTGTGGSTDRSGTLAGGAGSFPGDADIENVSFGIGDVPGGTVTAQITAPEAYVGAQDQEDWGDVDSLEDDIEVTSCSTEAQSDGSLEVSYALAPTGSTGDTTNVEIRVGGETVAGEFHDVPARGEGFTTTIPASDLPVGQDMPVEIGVEGNFSDCGTVTVAEETDPQPDEPTTSPENIGANCAAPAAEQTPGSDVEIPYTIYNNGLTEAAVEYEVTVGEEVAVSDTITLSAGSAISEDAVWTPTTAGEYPTEVRILNVA